MTAGDPSRAEQLGRWSAEQRSRHVRFLLRHRMVDVDRTIAPADAMFGGDLSTYLAVAMSALHHIDATLLAAGRPLGEIRRVLDLPCGHGRVLRGLRALFPDAELVACDLDRDGVDFCAAKFGAVPVYSAPDPADVVLPGSFDLIWVGSLLTHLDEPAWHGFLRTLEAALAPNGVLVFTVAGRLVAELVRAGDHSLPADQAEKLLAGWDREGFGFGSYGKASPSYGCAVASPRWVVGLLAEFHRLRMVTYSERAWDRRQDVIGLEREEPPAPP